MVLPAADATEAASSDAPATWWLVVPAALATPLVVVWFGVHRLALNLESLQPDGDLEAGGSFAIGVLAVELVLLCSVASAVAVAVLWRWIGRRPLAVLLTVVGVSAAITAVGVARSWG